MMLDQLKRLSSLFMGDWPRTGSVPKGGWHAAGDDRHTYHDLKEVLQLKLQQRRTREELVSQGIMPPLKSPAAFHEQRRSLERARTEDYLKRKIRSRPERSELVRMHILEETSVEPSLQAKQLKLKRARLADDLNEKIAQRPGPMELIEKNILPVESSLKEAIIDGQVDYPKVVDSSSFDEDSSDALSPEQPGSQDSQGSVPSPSEPRATELTLTKTISPTPFVPPLQTSLDSSKTALPIDQLQPMKLTNGALPAATKPAPALIKQTQPKSMSEKSQRSKKLKEPKPKVRKLKYHQYIPPDQKPEKGLLPMDSSYAKLLQQQQLFLQLQILNQQQQHYNYQTILPAPPKPTGDQQTNSTTAAVRGLATGTNTAASGSGSLARQNSNLGTGKLGALPANLDDMKVAELKHELKLRGLPVSGTKNDLLERLRAFQDQNAGAGSLAAPLITTTKPGGTGPLLPKATEMVVAFPAGRLGGAPALMTSMGPAEVVVATVTSNAVMKFGGSTSSTPPVSPSPSERSQVSMDENTASDAFSEMVTSPTVQRPLPASPVQVLVKEENGSSPCCLQTSRPEQAETRDKDQMLQEKDRQIEELTRMLRQKQQLVEVLRLQLEQEKRSQARASTAAALADPDVFSFQVKEEHLELPACAGLTANGQPFRVLAPDSQMEELSPKAAAGQADSSMPIQAVIVKEELEPEGRDPQQQQPPPPAAAPAVPHVYLTPHLQQLQAGLGVASEMAKNSSCTHITDSTGAHIVLTVTNQNAEINSLTSQQVSNALNPLSLVPSQAVIVKQESEPESGEQLPQQPAPLSLPPPPPLPPPAPTAVPHIYLTPQPLPPHLQAGGVLKGPPPALITDSKETRIIFTVTKPSSEVNSLTSQGKSRSRRITLQRVQSSPNKLSSQSQSQLTAASSSQSKQQLQPGLLNQPIRKGQKSDLHILANASSNAVFPFSAPPSLQPFFVSAAPENSSGPNEQPCPDQKNETQPGSPAHSTPLDMEQDGQCSAFLPAAATPEKEPPEYEEALKHQPESQQHSRPQNGFSSQQMDDLFDILIQTGEISAYFKEDASAALKTPTPPLNPSATTTTPLVSQDSSDLPQRMSIDVVAENSTNGTPGRLEDFLESTTGVPLLTGDNDGSEPLPLIADLHSEMLSSAIILDHPPSPMDTSELHFASDTAGLTLDLADAHLDNMDWLEMTSSSPSSSSGLGLGLGLGLTPLSAATPSLFSTDFLDSQDLQLHWDACL
ncbi:myocardin-related transcription factor A isoform X2 [Latimeria chalumnae]|uniref:myocardin-related transcription factor A isoform X2 n=1 Tax=Latimeria chalumnae TaxID=7897 RepID=UPI00313BC692